jgi:hypothetical protein
MMPATASNVVICFMLDDSFFDKVHDSTTAREAD